MQFLMYSSHVQYKRYMLECLQSIIHGMKINKSETITLLTNNKLQSLLHHIMLLRVQSEQGYDVI